MTRCLRDLGGFDSHLRRQNLLSESKHGVGASLLTKNELGSIPSRTAIIEAHTDPPDSKGDSD